MVESVPLRDVIQGQGQWRKKPGRGGKRYRRGGFAVGFQLARSDEVDAVAREELKGLKPAKIFELVITGS